MNLEKKLQKLINTGKYHARSAKESYYLTQYAADHGFETEVNSPVTGLAQQGMVKLYTIKLIPHA